MNIQKQTTTDKFVEKLETTSRKLKDKYKSEIISENEAIKIAREYRENKEYTYINDWKQKISSEYLKSDNYKYPYEIDWEHPRIRLEEMALKKNGGLTGGSGKKVLVWHVWFLPIQAVDPIKNIVPIAVDIDAKTGKIFTRYSLQKI